MNPLALMSPTSLLGVGLVVASVVAGLQTVRLANERTAHQTTKTQHTQMLTTQHEAARLAVEAARTEEQRRTQAVQEEVEHARTRATVLAADLAAARSAGQRLRDALAAYRAPASPQPSGAPATGGSPPADPTADLRALVQRRLDEAADDLAGFADAAHLAGATCQWSWGTLTAPASTTP